MAETATETSPLLGIGAQEEHIEEQPRENFARSIRWLLTGIISFSLATACVLLVTELLVFLFGLKWEDRTGLGVAIAIVAAIISVVNLRLRVPALLNFFLDVEILYLGVGAFAIGFDNWPTEWRTCQTGKGYATCLDKLAIIRALILLSCLFGVVAWTMQFVLFILRLVVLGKRYFRISMPNVPGGELTVSFSVKWHRQTEQASGQANSGEAQTGIEP